MMLAFGSSGYSAAAGKEAAAAEPTLATEGIPEKSRVTHGPKGEVMVTLDAETQKRIGLKLAPLASTNLAPVVIGFGRALDPSPLIQLVAELAPAEVSARASAQELERIKTLRTQENASERALQAAETQAVRDRLAAQALRARLALGWGTALADSEQLSDLAQSFATLQAALIRVDLPAGDSLPGRPIGAELRSLTAEPTPIVAEYRGAATSTDPQLQGRGFLFLVRTNPPPVGTAMTARLRTDGELARGVVIPADAIVRHEKEGWVYVQTAADQFTRRKASLDHASGDGYFVTRGFEAGDQVVTTGAQLLLSEELKGQGEEE